MKTRLPPTHDPDHKRAEAWKNVIAPTAGFVAKESVVSTLAVIPQASEEIKLAECLSPLQAVLRDGPGLTPLTALPFMISTLIYTLCLGTIAMIRREVGSWCWAAFTVGHGLVLGWEPYTPGKHAKKFQTHGAGGAGQGRGL